MIEDFLHKSKKLKVLIVGETIIDEFLSVEYQGQSMKSFCPVFSYSKTKFAKQNGGAAAIASHLKSFVKEVKLVTNTSGEIVKTRLIDKYDLKKHVEINKLDTHEFGKIKLDTQGFDLIIVADFGHGFCDNLILKDEFHLMCQTNSHNFGFNRLSKWKNHSKRSVCLDLREASLQLNHKIDDCTDDIVKELFDYEMNTTEMYVTMGLSGSVYTDGENITRNGIFKTNVVDSIGAGDAFFSFACLTSHLNLPIEERLIIPSLAASLSTTWLCNENSINPENLEKFYSQSI